ncbi:stalk domain-containing protein [Peptoniphilus sp. DNF00840]|uniref:stalk domain-containing protein n=1 Tax=Peptoniphilus sp. DNF00840 TaxID=1477000 RepID=UPI0007822E5F|nr:stalk domain-containing protein [Peptoniphilus sp. DNF00840]KXB71578.1 copper amine oxidase domain protein [Peptoniphilus sp. DNF00840]
MKKTKRYFILFLSLVMLLSTVNVFAVRHKERDIALNGIIVNDHIVYSDVYPYIKNSRTYVPIRFIAEELGYDVKWDGANKKVTMTSDGTTVELTIGSNKMMVNGKAVLLDAPAEIRDDRTFVPLRAIAEAFGEKVDYSSDYRAVYIGDNPKYNAFYKVVYYYEKKETVISEYTINIATYKMDVNGNVTRFGSIKELVNVVYDDFYDYGVSGVSKYGVTTYKTQYIQPKEEVKYVKAPKTNVAKEKQLKDAYYVVSTDDILVGSWYGPGGYNDYDNGVTYPTDRYTYITSLGNGRYKLTNRVILGSDKNSEYFTEQYGYYDKNKNALVVEKSHSTYGEKGYFEGMNSESLAGEYYLENSYTKLSWKKVGSSYYMDKY